MAVGFKVDARTERAEFEIFGVDPSRPHALVSFHRTSGGAAALMGRLFYRREKLAGISSEAAKTNDAALALETFLAGGVDAVTQLEGDFCVVIWDARARRLIMCRDPMGGYPLFWMTRDGGVTISTRLRPLVAGSPRERIDLDYVAEFVMQHGPGRDEMDSERCAFLGVHRLRPGSTLDISMPAGDALQQRRFWNWGERVTSPISGTLEDVSAEYLRLLRESVRERMVGRTTAHFSGGMDSTAVALLAGDLAKAGLGEGGTVGGLSVVYEKLTGLARERPYIEAALQDRNGVDWHSINGDELLDYDAYADPPLFDEPCVGLERVGMVRALVRLAADIGANTTMTGLGADEVVDVPPYYLGTLMRRGRFVKAWSEAGRVARVLTTNRWKIFKPYALAALKPAWLRGGVGPLVRGGFANWPGQTESTIPPWIRPEFASRHDLKSIRLRNLRKHHARRDGTSAVPPQTIAGIEAHCGDMARAYLGAPAGVHITHPYFDPRLLCFGMAIPPTLSYAAGVAKPILAEATRDLLPDVIRLRKRKGHFNEVYFQGLHRNLPRLTRLVKESPLCDLGVFDSKSILDCLNQTAMGTVKDLRGVVRLNRSLSLLNWISNLDAWSKLVDEPTARHVVVSI